MFSAEWIRDERLRRQPAHVQLLLLFIRHLCDRNGRFEFNPALIHMALYVSAKVSNVSARDVEAWLEILRSGGFIKTYTGAAGRRVGEVATEYWRQKLSYGKEAFEPEADQPELELPAADPPPVKTSKRSGGAGKKSPPPFTSHQFTSPAASTHPADPETDLQWLARLTREWPGIEIEAQLAKAHKKRRGDVERGWFEAVWLPGVTPVAPRPDQVSGLKSQVSDAPPGWRETLEQLYPGNAVSANPERTWASVDPDTRAKVLAHGKTRAA
jgi:hypothetical protein